MSARSVTLVRHGQTERSARLIYCGQADYFTKRLAAAEPIVIADPAVSAP